MISWSSRPGNKTSPGVINFSWSLNNSSTQVRWYVEPIDSSYPSNYSTGARSTSVTIADPGFYVFHIEAKSTTGETEERVTLFEVLPQGEDPDPAIETNLWRLPDSRQINFLSTKTVEVPFRGTPSSSEQNKWISDTVKDLQMLHDQAAALKQEIDLKARLGVLERLAQQSLIEEKTLIAVSQTNKTGTKTIDVKAIDFTEGMPSVIEQSATKATVDKIYGEIAPALIGDPENKLGWPDRYGLNLPESLSATTSPAGGSYFETNPLNAIDGRMESSWVRETQQSPRDIDSEIITYRLMLPAGISAERFANRIDLMCSPSHAVDIQFIKVFNGSTWELIEHWPKLQTSTELVPLAMQKINALRLRFPDKKITGLEIGLKPSFDFFENGFRRSIVGLSHLSLVRDPISWSTKSYAYAKISSKLFPPGNIRIASASPLTNLYDIRPSVKINLYKVSSGGAWVPMNTGESLVGEDLGIVLELTPQADMGWSHVLNGVSVSYQAN